MLSKHNIVHVESDKWNTFFQTSKNKIPFSSLEWTSAICNLFDYEADHIIAADNKNAVCGITVYYTKVGGKKFAVHPYLTPYNTIIISYDSTMNSDVINALLDYIRVYYAYPYFLLDPWIDDSAIPSGWNSVLSNTYIVNPQNSIPDNDILRRSRRCTEQGFYIKYEFNPESFLQLFNQTVARQGILIHPDKNKFMEFLESIGKAGFAWMASSYDAMDNLHACWVQVGYDQVLFNWNAASDSALLNKGGTSFLVTNMYERIKTKYQIWDLCGADIQGVAKFKSGIGGILTPYKKISFTRYSAIRKIEFRLRKYFN